MVATIPNEDRIAIAEVDYIIHHMNERYLNKIPQKILDYITILKKRNIDIYVDPRLPLENQGLQEFTLQFLMVLNLKYWCSEERRQEILLMMESNQKKFDERVNNIFQQAENIQGDLSSSEKLEDLSKPKKVIVTNIPENTDKEDNKEIEKSEEKEEKIEEKNDEELKGNMEVISQDEEKGFFSKLISKIKSIFIKK